jgi:hypothetical protein
MEATERLSPVVSFEGTAPVTSGPPSEAPPLKVSTTFREHHLGSKLPTHGTFGGPLKLYPHYISDHKPPLTPTPPCPTFQHVQLP